MLETALRADALGFGPDGYELRVGLPWIRSMPLSSVGGVAVEVDGVAVPPGNLRVQLAGRSVAPESLVEEGGWWFIQDRLVLRWGPGARGGRHVVAVGFQLMVPYLQAGPDLPLVLPFRLEAGLDPARAALPGVSRDVA